MVNERVGAGAVEIRRKSQQAVNNEVRRRSRSRRDGDGEKGEGEATKRKGEEEAVCCLFIRRPRDRESVPQVPCRRAARPSAALHCFTARRATEQRAASNWKHPRYPEDGLQERAAGSGQRCVLLVLCWHGPGDEQR